MEKQRGRETADRGRDPIKPLAVVLNSCTPALLELLELLELLLLVPYSVSRELA